MKWHFSEKTGRPQLCKANINCPLTGEHFKTQAEAWTHYENKFNNVIQTLHKSKKEKTKKSNDEILEILMSNFKQKYVAYGLKGSHLYGIATPKSDFDATIIQEGKDSPRQLIIGDLDVTIQSTKSFLHALKEGQIVDVDLLFSRKMKIDKNNHFRQMFNNFNVNPYQYYSNSYSIALSTFNEKKQTIEKKARNIVRYSLLANKMLKQQKEFCSVFTHDELNVFYDMKKDIMPMIGEGTIKGTIEHAFSESYKKYFKEGL